MTMAALFVAQATNTPLTLTQQLTILAVALLTLKGASGVQECQLYAAVASLPAIEIQSNLSVHIGGRVVHAKPDC